MLNNIVRIIIVLLFLTFINNIFSAETIVQNEIIIFPFKNINKIDKYDYLNNIIIDAIIAKLKKDKHFNVIFYTPNVEIFYQLDSKIWTDEIQAYNIARNLKKDVFIIGQYSITENKLKIEIIAVDIITAQSIVGIEIISNLGIDLLDSVDKCSDTIANKIISNMDIGRKIYYEKKIKELDAVLKKRAIESGSKNDNTTLTSQLKKNKILVLNNKTVDIDKETALSYMEITAKSMFKKESFDILDRKELIEVFDSLHLSMFDEFDKKSALRIAKLLNADIVVIGSVIKSNNKVIIDAISLDTNTGKIIITKKLSDSE